MTLADLGLTPLDVIDVVKDPGGTGSAELDDRVRRHIVVNDEPRPDALLQIRYMEAEAGQISVFVASALVARLRAMVTQSRPLRASDVALPGQAATADSVEHIVDRARLAGVVDDLSDLRDRIDTAIAAGAALLDDPVANRAALLARIDGRIATVVERLAEAAAFGAATIGWGAAYDWRTERFRALLSRMAARLERWEQRLAECNTSLDADEALPPATPDAERIRLLRAAEAQVSTTLAADLDPAGLRNAVLVKRDAFDAKRGAMQAATIDAPDPALADRLARCVGVLPLDAFDPEPLAFVDIEDSIVQYQEDLQAITQAARDDVETRLAAATNALTAHDAALDAAARLAALQDGATAIFGEGFRLIPSFSPPADAAAELTQAHAAFTSGALLAHASAVADDDFPLDTWFYGCARVRPKMRLLEDTTMLWDAHRLDPGRLFALQLPHRDGAPWLALDFPKEAAPDSERLAYVAFARSGYDPAGERCGLLVDDWSETIPAIEPDEPGPQHTTGVAFHFDRPSQEPPQAMLLLTPATWDGQWSWDDVVHGVIDTFALARLRAVEPAQLEGGPLAQFLPATVASVTTSGLSISANYALVNMDVRYVRTLADG